MRYNTLLATALVVGLGTGTSYADPIPAVELATATQNGTNVDVTVQLNVGFRFIQSAVGDNELFLFNDALPGSSITNVLSFPNKPPGGGLFGLTNLPPVSTPAGDFTASIECVDSTACVGASTPEMTFISFTVTNATVADLQTPNSSGEVFFADALGPEDTTVPEPSTLALLGLGFLGLRAVRRNKAT
jgi:hypothetical protein